LKNQNIIIVGQQPWDTEIGSNCKNIALEFSKQNRVLYINPPLDRISRMRHAGDKKVQKRLSVIRGKQSGLEEISPGLFTLYPDCLIESVNWLPRGFIFKAVNRLNNKRFYRSVSAVIESLGFNDAVLFNDGDMFRSFYLIELLEPAASIYYSRDNMIATSYYRKHGLAIEPLLIAKNDLCVANSEYLAGYCRKYNPNSAYVGQGCDFSLFDHFLRNPALALPRSFSGIVIGYVGVLTSARLDIGLIVGIAKQRPDWNILLVGPEDADFTASELHRLTNVHFMGARPTDELPMHIDGFDICFNPQVLNDLTVGNYPRKIDEYLVLGKATIATATPSMHAFKEHVYLAEGVEGYIEGIETLLGSNTPEKANRRAAFARSHSWEKSVQEIYDALALVIEEKRSAS
jgi:teichuronic acid biosynthesis glycosyltransferase TuaH